MLDSPLRIFRCYICVENRMTAPLTDLSLLVEHLAMHLEFHLFMCRGCDQKFATPFIANFHIKEGRCKKEEGELCDDGGSPLKVVDLETVEFERFCHLQNAVTKCTELMLYELNYGEHDLINALSTNKLIPQCPNSPEPIRKEERQVQTSPPLDPAPTATTTAASGTFPAASAPNPHVAPGATSAVSSINPPERSPSDMSLETNSSMDSGPKMNELADGCSFISDDEEEEPRKSPQVISIEVEDGLSMVSDSPASTAPPETPPRSSTPRSSPPSTTATTAGSIPSLLSLKFNDMLDWDLPPRRDVRQPVVMLDPPPAPPPKDFVEADSSSSATVQPFFFQALPPKPKRAVSGQNLSSLNDAVYPVLAPVYSAGVRVFPGQQQLMHQHSGPGYSGQMPLSQSEGMLLCQNPPGCSMQPLTVGEVSSSTNCMPCREDRRVSDNMPVFPSYGEHNLSPIRVESPVHGHLPHDFIADGKSSIEDRPESDLSSLSFDDDGHLLDDDATMNLNITPPRSGKELDHRPKGQNEEWMGFEERITEQRHGSVAVHSSRKVSTRNLRGEKPRYSYGITVIRSFDPHSGTTTLPRRRRNSSGRHSRTSSRGQSSQKRSRTTGPPLLRASRSRSLRALRRRNRSPSSSPMRSNGSIERRRYRDKARKFEKFEIFPASILDEEMPSTSRDSERSRHRSRSRRRIISREEDRDALKGEEKLFEDESSSKSSDRQSEGSSDIEVLEVIQHVADRARRSPSTVRTSHFADWKKKQIKLSRVPLPTKLPKRKQLT